MPCIVVVPAVPMMLLKGSCTEGERNRCSEELRRLQKPKRASSTRAKSHRQLAPGQRAKNQDGLCSRRWWSVAVCTQTS
ncbi:hypothetical protein V8C34DRAFT_31432 [Trichoderma compactum]